MSAPGIDHRDEALRLLAVANDRHADADPEGGAIFTAQAQVHATLAAGEGDLAERYRRAYAETLLERDELRAAVRTALYEADEEGATTRHLLRARGVRRLRTLVGVNCPTSPAHLDPADRHPAARVGAPMSRVWEVNGPVAEYRGGHWRIGTVVAADPLRLAIRWDGTDWDSYRSPTDQHLTDPDSVPIDERHWRPASVRDQLVRQEAAGRLRAGAAAMPSWFRHRSNLSDLAELIEDLLMDDGDGELADAARALLSPAPQPATTPTTEGLPS